ncbi:MAG TPA: serine hydrolase domain-containing protein [Vicinamibacterales bacterium]|nr:serine hydrolase domain-containing protein [Vicinamibacterales bacterium]
MTARSFNWLTALALVVGVMFAAGAGILTFVRGTLKPPLHPDPAAAPSVQDAAPLPGWAGPVAQAEQIARSALSQQNLPGLSVAVGIDEAIVWAEGFGWADMETQVPVSPRTRFRISHASNALTSAAVGWLLDQRQLRLDDEIQAWVPEFPRQQWPVTLRQLMAHTAGVRHYRDEGEYEQTSKHCERAVEGVASFAQDPLLFEPDTRYKYSTYGWVLVSAAVEAAAAEPFPSFMRRRIFGPAGMSATTFDGAADALADRSTAYEAEWNENRRPAAAVDYSCLSGAGGIVSTPSDLVRFGLAMENAGLLKRTIVDLLQTPQILATGAETKYGLGWMLESARLAGTPTRLAYHSGRTLVGGTASLLTFPDRGLVVAVTANIAFADTKGVGLAVAEAFARSPKR